MVDDGCVDNGDMMDGYCDLRDGSPDHEPSVHVNHRNYYSGNIILTLPKLNPVIPLMITNTTHTPYVIETIQG